MKKILAVLLLYSASLQAQSNKGILIHGISKGLWVNNGNIGIGVSSPDSSFHILGGFHSMRGVRMENLPIGTGTKAVRIDASGKLSIADTTSSGVSIYTFSNGLTESSGAVSLGGTLTGTVTINGASNSLNLGATGSKLSFLNINANKIVLNGPVSYGVETYSTDADHTLSTSVPIVELIDPTLTTNRTVTMPSASIQGQTITIITRNSAGSNHYVLSSAITDNSTGSTFTQLDWGKTYDFYVSSSLTWLLIRKY